MGDQPPAIVTNIPFPEKIKLDGNHSQLAVSFTRFKRAWDSYEVASRVKEQSAEIRAAHLRACLGEDAQEVLEGLHFENEADRLKTDSILEALKTFCIGKVNVTYERYNFFTKNQQKDENIDQYVGQLRYLAKTCDFGDLEESLIKDRVVTGMIDNSTRKKLLCTDALDLKKCIDICRSNECSMETLKAMTGACASGEDDTVHRVQKKGKKEGKHWQQKKPERYQKKNDRHVPNEIDCLFCGKKHEKNREKCPAWGQSCRKCSGKNHFSIKCKSKKSNLHSVDDYDVIDCVTTVNNLGSQMYAEMKVEGRPVSFHLDTGASNNLISANLIGDTELTTTDTTLVMWNKDTIQPVGQCRLRVINPKTGNKYLVRFIVVKEKLPPILGAKAIVKMNLVTVNHENFKSVDILSVKVSDKTLIEKYAEVFGPELGSLPGVAHFEVDESVTPVVSPSRNVPVAIKPKLKECLDKMTEMGVIQPVSQPTDWVNNIVVCPKKSGELRICLDPRPLNKALRRERFQLPTLKDVLPNLSKAKVYSSFDLRNGYWHVLLDEASSLLTSFDSPYGRFKYSRLPFGTNVSSEMFQRRLFQAIGDLQGVLAIADDVLVYGVGENFQEALNDHEVKLELFLQRCKKIGIRLNKDKMKLRQTTIPFFGNLLTDRGVCADPEKIKAIVEMPAPVDVQGVQRLCGTVNFLADFLPSLSDVMEPIRKLTCKDVPFNWASAQQKAFAKVKEMITNAPVLQYYDEEKELTVQCDASQGGLGAALLQEGKPVAFASRTLTDPETRYAQIEKELLAIVFSLEKFNQYTYGRKVVVHSDHKPLEAIMAKPLVKAPKRLQGMMLRLQKYDIEVKYLKGKHMYLADTLSRAYLPTPKDKGPQDDLTYVHMTNFLPITERRMNIIKESTKTDQTLQSLKSVIMDGWPEDKHNVAPEVMPYFHFRDELTVVDGIILRGDRVVIPVDMRATMKEKIHSSHLGVTGCLRRARESLYWPNMSNDIKDHISKCETCRELDSANQPETLMSHDIPDRPWAKVGTDLFHLHGENYLVTVDYFSGLFEVDRLHDTNAKAVIRKLKSHFSRYGSPQTLVSDNGPPYSSQEFSEFAEQWDFDHSPSSPGHSQSNGKAEAAVKTAKSLMKKAKKTGGDIYMALLDYRNTPSQGMDNSPAQRALGRRTRTLLPTTQKLLNSGEGKNIKKQIVKKQEKQQEYFNQKAKDLPQLEESDVVRMKPFIKGKSWRKGQIVKRLDERSYEVEVGNKVYRRNRVHLRKTNEPPPDTVITQEQRSHNYNEMAPLVATPPRKSSRPRESETKIQSEASAAHKPGNTPATGSPVDTPTQVPSAVTTRSGRTVKVPSRYKD